MSQVAEVKLWGRTIGAVSLEEGKDVAVFEYDSAFAGSGVEIAPLTMPLSDKVYSFPELSRMTFRGLPGLLADSLPDRFGNALIDVWWPPADNHRNRSMPLNVSAILEKGELALWSLSPP